MTRIFRAYVLELDNKKPFGKITVNGKIRYGSVMLHPYFSIVRGPLLHIVGEYLIPLTV